jgi:general secretion pathway protein K
MKRQRGLAAVTAILIVAIAASAATLMLAQQSAMLDQTMLVASRAQADQYSRAGIDWLRGVLLEDFASSPQFDSLDEGWAQPIAALPVERAVVSGAIADEQGKFNLDNLVSGPGLSASKSDIEVFKRILASQGLAPELADAVVDWLDADEDLYGTSGAESSYYLSLPRPYRAANTAVTQIEELYRVRGFDAAAVRKLRPFVTALAPATA